MTEPIKIRSISIRYSDYSETVINEFELEKMEKLSSAIELIERARQVYYQLKPIIEVTK